MDDVLKVFGIFTAMGLAGSLVYAAIALVNVMTRRLDGRSLGSADSLRQELDDLRAHVEENDQLRNRVLELEERLEFAERLLSQQREPARLPEGQGP